MAPRSVIVFGTVTIVLAAAIGPAAAQGIPVFDSSSYVQALSTVSNTLKMVQQGEQEITTATNQLNALQKLTNVNSIASNLFSPTTRNILPATTTEASTLFSGDLSKLGSLGTLASSIQSRYVMTSSSSSSADAAYGQALKDATGSSAAAAALGENTLSLTQTRMQGLDQLRAQLDAAKDPKDVMDLQVRISVEQAQLENDMLKLQAVQMAQNGESQLGLAAAVTTRARNAASLYDDNILRK